MMSDLWGIPSFSKERESAVRGRSGYYMISENKIYFQVYCTVTCWCFKAFLNILLEMSFFFLIDRIPQCQNTKPIFIIQMLSKLSKLCIFQP